MIRFILNDKEIATGLSPGITLLDFIRYQQHLTGTKIGCREGDCGACTVLVGKIVNSELFYESMTSCLVPLGNVLGKHVVTIEGINFPDKLNPIQEAMADCGATQCGFCTPGFVVSLAGFCLSDKEPTEQNAVAAMDGNICRCTGYKSIQRAAGKVAAIMSVRKREETTTFVAQHKILPEYFTEIKEKLESMQQPVSTLRQACLSGRQAQGDKVIGGGTDLYVQKHEEMAHADIRFVFDDPGLNSIVEENGKCVIGPSVTVSDLKHSSLINKIFPDFQRYAKLVSSTPIRNMATIAGNFVNASPIGDLTIFFLALDAQIDLAPNLSPEDRGFRTVPLKKFYKGYKQLDKQPGEIISKIWFEIPEKNSFFNFEKVSKRTHLDIASVNSAILITMNGNEIVKARLSAGGVGPVPMYLQKTSEFLIGKKINEETINTAIGVMNKEISPISDARGSREYKTLLLGQLIKAHFGERRSS